MTTYKIIRFQKCVLDIKEISQKPNSKTRISKFYNLEFCSAAVSSIA